MTKMARRTDRVCCLVNDISRVRARRSTTRYYVTRVRTRRPITQFIIFNYINNGMGTAIVTDSVSIIGSNTDLLSLSLSPE